jgi:hypothetical protein
MGLYCRIENGAVVEGPRPLPVSFVVGDSEILAFNTQTAEQVAAYGWLPLSNEEPTPAPTGQVIASVAVEMVAGVPTQVATYAPAPVPQVIEMAKAKLQMLDTPWPAAGEGATLLDAVEAAVVAGGRALQIEFSRTTLSRTRDLVVGLQAGFGISDAQMDALFIAADARP